MDTWLPRGCCGPWTPELRACYIAANLGIFAAYIAIPIQIFFFFRRGLRLGTKLQTVLWVAFIFLCGGGHLLENVGAFWRPNYPIFTAWHVATATVSIYTAITFPFAMIGVFRGLDKLQAELKEYEQKK